MIKPLRDRALVESFMALPEIYKYAAPPGAGDAATFTTDSGREIWLGFYVDGFLSGIIKVQIETGSMAMFHPYILQEHKAFYKSMALMFFSWVKGNMPKELLKLNACVPVIFKRTIAIAEESGMAIEGVDTLSYRHKFGVCDRILLGIKVADIQL